MADVNLHFSSLSSPELPGAPSNLVISNISPRSATLQFRPGYDGKTSISRWIVEGQVWSPRRRGLALPGAARGPQPETGGSSVAGAASGAVRGWRQRGCGAGWGRCGRRAQGWSLPGDGGSERRAESSTLRFSIGAQMGRRRRDLSLHPGSQSASRPGGPSGTPFLSAAQVDLHLLNHVGRACVFPGTILGGRTRQ